jgi:hypothetical protein
VLEPLQLPKGGGADALSKLMYVWLGRPDSQRRWRVILGGFDGFRGVGGNGCLGFEKITIKDVVREAEDRSNVGELRGAFGVEER